eukprot:1403056-Prymnesium_polylepis.1
MPPTASPKSRSRKSSSDHRDKKREDDPEYDKKRAEAEKERRKRQKLEKEAAAAPAAAAAAAADAETLAAAETLAGAAAAAAAPAPTAAEAAPHSPAPAPARRAAAPAAAAPAAAAARPIPWELDWAELNPMYRAAAELLGCDQKLWDEQGWRRRFTGDGIPTATDLLEVIEIMAHRLHDPNVPINPWKTRKGDPGTCGQFSKDDDIAPYYLVRGWFGAEDEEVAIIESDGKPPDVRWVSEDVLLNAIERRHSDPECDSSLLELLTDYTSAAVRHTLDRARALGLKGSSTCAPMAAVTKVLKSNLSAATAAAAEAAEAATSDEREAKLASAEVSLALNRAVAVEYGVDVRNVAAASPAARAAAAAPVAAAAGSPPGRKRPVEASGGSAGGLDAAVGSGSGSGRR